VSASWHSCQYRAPAAGVTTRGRRCIKIIIVIARPAHRRRHHLGAFEWWAACLANDKQKYASRSGELVCWRTRAQLPVVLFD
jgi:hypothetical protein